MRGEAFLFFHAQAAEYKDGGAVSIAKKLSPTFMSANGYLDLCRFLSGSGISFSISYAIKLFIFLVHTFLHTLAKQRWALMFVTVPYPIRTIFPSRAALIAMLPKALRLGGDGRP